MLARAAAKGLETLEADAQRLPLPDASADAVMLVSMLHHVENPAAALAEAQRILRPQGRLALMVFTREDVADTWLEDYFPSTRAWMDESHPTLAALQALLPGARRIPVTYTDLEDGSLAALAGHPEKLADPRWHRQTSFFERLERELAGRAPGRPRAPPLRSRRRPRAEKARPRDRAGLPSSPSPRAREPEGEAVRSGRRPDSIRRQVGPTHREESPCGSRSRDATFRSPTSCVRS